MKVKRLLQSIDLFLLIVFVSLLYTDYKQSIKDVKMIKKEFEEDNSDFVKLYNDYLTILSKHYKNSDVDNVFNEFSFMLRNGYISYGPYFDPSEPELDVCNYGGIDVINGKGVCRNVNCCFTDLLKKMGYDAGNMYGILELENEKYYRPNHVITWVKKDNKIYIYDVANNIKYDKLLDFYYNSDEKMLFIPCHIMTKKLNDTFNLSTIPYTSCNDKTIEIDYTNMDYSNFEKNNLLDIEKEVYTKIKSLQSNQNMLK